MARPFRKASAEETSRAAEELSPEPSGTVLRISRLAGSTGIAGAHQFVRHADGVIGPCCAAGRPAMEAASNSLVSLSVLRNGCAACRRDGAAATIGGQVERHWQDEAEVVIGMLADHVDAAGRAEDAQAIGCAIDLSKMLNHDLPGRPAGRRNPESSTGA